MAERGLGRGVRRGGAALLLSAALAAGCAPSAPQNLVMVSLDTTRQDHLSLYGYPRPTTPRIDREAAKGVVFQNAFTQWNSTVPSHTSMLTGLYPHTHRNRRGAALAEVTLTEILAGAGFRTGAFVGGFTMKAKTSNLDVGFEVYSDRFPGTRRDGGEVMDEAIDWVTALEPEERYFLFVHFYDAHGPYREHPSIDEFRDPSDTAELGFIPDYQTRRDEAGPITDYDHYRASYDSQIRYQDELVARLLDRIDLKRTLVVIIADHGETLAERHRAYNLNHGHNLFVEQVLIPLAMFGAGVEARTVEAPVETVDLTPTLLDLLRVEPPADARFQGRNLTPVLRGERGQSDRLTFSTSAVRNVTVAGSGYPLDEGGLIHSVQSREWKLIVYPGLESEFLELYHRPTDPGETTDVGDRNPEVRDRLRLALADWLALADGDIPDPQDADEDLKALRALGYVD